MFIWKVKISYLKPGIKLEREKPLEKKDITKAFSILTTETYEERTELVASRDPAGEDLYRNIVDRFIGKNANAYEWDLQLLSAEQIGECPGPIE